MAKASLHRTRSITTLLVCFAMSGCNAHPFITDQDARDVVALVAEKSVAKFGKNTCIVAQFGADSLGDPSLWPFDGEVVGDGRMRFWVLPGPAITFPNFVAQKYHASPRNGGCERMIRLGPPDFFDVAEKGQRRLVAVENVEVLCRPKCGKTFAAQVEKHGNAFTLSTDDIQPLVGGIP